MKPLSGASAVHIGPILGDVPKIISGPPVESAMVLVQRAEELAQNLKDLKMAQVRDIFDELRQIESLWTRDPDIAIRRLYLLKPRLAYRSARIKELLPLAQVLERAVNEVVNAGKREEMRARFRRLMEFAEAIVAYHKVHEGGK